MGRRSLAALAALLLLLVLPVGSLGAESPGVIEGQVVNKTAGGGSVDSVEVTLHSWIGQAEQELVKLRADAQGRFRFANLDTAPDRAYVATVEYGQTTYRGAVLIFQTGETTRTIELAVFDPTTEAGQVRVQRAHVIIDLDSQAGVLSVMEMLLVNNPGDRAYVGSQDAKSGIPGETLRIALPEGASGLELGSGAEEEAVPTQEGFAYTGPLAPGNTEIVYSYQLRYAGGSLKFARSISYPVDRLNVLMPDQGIRLSSDLLSTMAPVDMGNRRYQHLAGEGLPANTPITLQLGGSASVDAAGDQDTMKWVIPGLTAVGMGVALVYPVWRRREPGTAGPRRSAPRRRTEEQEEEELEPELR